MQNSLHLTSGIARLLEPLLSLTLLHEVGFGTDTGSRKARKTQLDLGVLREPFRARADSSALVHFVVQGRLSCAWDFSIPQLKAVPIQEYESGQVNTRAVYAAGGVITLYAVACLCDLQRSGQT